MKAVAGGAVSSQKQSTSRSHRPHGTVEAAVAGYRAATRHSAALSVLQRSVQPRGNSASMDVKPAPWSPAPPVVHALSSMLTATA